jgi:hypothetical protein
MNRPILRILVSGLLVVSGGFAVYRYDRNRTEALLQAQVKELQAQKQHLQDYVARLTSQRRLAEMVVTEQTTVGGLLKTTLLFSELGPDGSRLPPRFFTIDGNVVHIEALVIRFDLEYVEKDDPMRGRSLALFHRLYGDFQMPSEGFSLDEPGKAPDFFACVDAPSQEVRNFEAGLWKNFWKLADDATERQKRGVRLVQGEGPWRPVYPEFVYTISLETAGGLTVASRPMDELFRQYQQAVARRRGG